MIEKTFIHCTGIGPKTDQRLKSIGLHSWSDCLVNPNSIPFSGQRKIQFLQQIEKSLSALKKNDINYLVKQLPIKEHWRILGTYFDKATFFDIETTGLSSYDSIITTIVAYHNKNLHTFLFQENLDDFLELVDDSKLLVAFNGNSFDIPFVEKAFNIPDIGCPFIDLRWICYYMNLQGGLKSIEKQVGIQRPKQIESIDGFEAVSLFLDWQNGDLKAKEKLVSYCQADVLSIFLVAHKILLKLGLTQKQIDQKQVFAAVKCK